MAKFFGKGKKSFLKGIKKSSKRNLQLEPLEERQLLSVNPTWVAEKSVNSTTDGTSLTLEFAEALKNDPTLQDKPVVFGIRVSAGNNTDADSTLDPGQIQISNKDQDGSAPVVRGIYNNYQGTKDTLLLVQLKPGDYNITINGENSTTGAFTCEVFMPGDFSKNEANTFGSTTSLVEQPEYQMFMGALQAQNTTDPYTTVNEYSRLLFQQMYGHSYEWFKANSAMFDIDGNGTVNNADCEIASINYQFSDAMKKVSPGYSSDENIIGDNGIKLVADNSGSQSLIDITDDSETGVIENDGKTAYVSSLKNLTGTVRDTDGNDSGSKISKIDIVIKDKDTGAVYTMTIDPADSTDPNSSACTPTPDGTEVQVDFSKLDWGDDQDEIDDLTDFDLYLEGTDEYGNSNIQHNDDGDIILENGEPVASDGATLSPVEVHVDPMNPTPVDYKPTINVVTYTGTEDQDIDSGLNYKVDLNDLIGTLITRNNDTAGKVPLYFGAVNASNTPNTLVFASDVTGENAGWVQGSFTKVFTDEKYKDGINDDTATVIYQYRVFKDGMLELQILEDSAAWLTADSTNPLNELILELNIASTDAYHAGSDKIADWATGKIKIDIDPANNAPVADLFEDSVSNKVETEIHILDEVSDADRWDHISLSKIGDYSFPGTDPTADNTVYATLVQDAAEPKVWYLGTLSADEPASGKYIILTRSDAAITGKPQVEHILKVDVNGYFNDLAEGETTVLVFRYTAVDDSNSESSANARISITGEHTDPAIVPDQTFFISLNGGVWPGLIHTYENGVITRDHGYVKYTINESWNDDETKTPDIADFTLGKATFTDGTTNKELAQADDLFYITPEGEIYCDSTASAAELANYINTNFPGSETVTMTIEVTVTDNDGKYDTGTISVTVMRKGLPTVDLDGVLVDSSKSLTEDDDPVSKFVTIDQSLLYGLWEISANADETQFGQIRAAVTESYDETNCYKFSGITLNTAKSQFKASESAAAADLTDDGLLVWARKFFNNSSFAWTDLENYVHVSKDANDVFQIKVDTNTFGFLGRGQSINLAFDVEIADKDFTCDETTRTMYVTINGVNDAPVANAANFEIGITETETVGTAYPASDYAEDVDYLDALNFTDVKVNIKDSSTNALNITASPVTGGRSGDDIMAALTNAAGEEGVANYLKAALTIGSDVNSGKITVTQGELFTFLRAGEKLTIVYDGTISDGEATCIKPITLAVTGVTTVPSLIDSGTLDLGSKKDIPVVGEPTSLSGPFGFTNVENQDLQICLPTFVSGTVTESGKSDITDIIDWSGLTQTALNGMLSKDVDNIVFTDGTSFRKLTEGQTLTLNYTYKAMFNDGTSDIVSLAKNLTVKIIGTNQAPVLDASPDGYDANTEDNPFEISLQSRTLSNGVEYNEDLTISNLIGLHYLTDADDPESFTFYKIGNIILSETYQEYSTVKDGVTTVWGSVRTYDDGRTLLFKADSSFKYGLGADETANFIASLIVKDSKGTESNAADFTFQLKGVYDAPAITPVNLTISNSYGGNSATDDQLSSFQTISGQVDHNLTGTWSIESVKWLNTSDTAQTTPTDWSEWATYFEITKDASGNAKIQFTSAEQRTAFIELFDADLGVAPFKGEDYKNFDFTFEVKLTDNYATPGSDTENIKLNVIDKMEPVVNTGDLVMPTAVNEDVDSITGADLTALVVTEADDVTVPRTDTWWRFGNFKVNVEKTWDSVSDSLKSLDSDQITAIKSKIAGLTLADADLWDSSTKTAIAYSLALTDEFDFLAPGTSITLYYTIDVIDTQYGCATPVEITTEITGVLDIPTAGTATAQTIEDTSTSLNSPIDFAALFTAVDATGIEAFYKFDITVNTAYTDNWGTFTLPTGYTTANDYFKDLIVWNEMSKQFNLTTDTDMLDVLKQIPQNKNTVFTFSIVAKNGTDDSAAKTAAATFVLTVNGTNQAPDASNFTRNSDTDKGTLYVSLGNLGVNTSTVGHEIAESGDIDYGDNAKLEFVKASFTSADMFLIEGISDADRRTYIENLLDAEANTKGYASADLYLLSLLKFYANQNETNPAEAGSTDPIQMVGFELPAAFEGLRTGEYLRVAFGYQLSDGTASSASGRTISFEIHGTSTKPVPTDGVQNLGTKVDVPTGEQPTTLTGSVEFTNVEDQELTLADVISVKGKVSDNIGATVNEWEGASTWFNITEAELKAMLHNKTGAAGTIEFADNEAFKKLAVGQTLTLTYTYTAQYNDGTADIASDGTKTVTVEIIGTNQDPTVTNDTKTASAAETESSTVSISDYEPRDVDDGDTAFTFSAKDISSYSIIAGDSRDNAALTNALQNSLGETDETEIKNKLLTLLTIDAANGNSATFNPGDYFKFLRSDEKITIYYELSISDKNGGTKDVNYNVTVNGSATKPEITDSTTPVYLGFKFDTGSPLDAALDSGIYATDVEDYALIVNSSAINTTASILTYRGSDTNLDSTYFTGTGRFADLQSNYTLTYDNENDCLVFTYGNTLRNLKQGETLTLSINYTVKNANNQVSDAQKTVTVVIDGTNQAPTAVNVERSLDETDDNDVLNITTDTDLNASDVDFGETAGLKFTGIVVDTDTYAVGYSAAETGAAGNRTETEIATAFHKVITANSGLLQSLLVAREDKTVTFTPGNYFDFLREGESITVYYTLTISDVSGGTKNVSYAVTVNGSNTVPTVKTDATLDYSVDQASTAGQVIDWFGNLNNPDYGNGEEIRTEITTINGVEVTCNSSNTTAQTISVSDTAATNNNGKYGDIVISWDSANKRQVVTWVPVENEFIKWNSLTADDGVALPVSIVVRNVYVGMTDSTFDNVVGASVTETVNITTYSGFNWLEYTTPADPLEVVNTKAAEETGDFADYVFAGTFKYKAENQTNKVWYNFDPKTAFSGYVKLSNDNSAKEVSVYILKTAMETGGALATLDTYQIEFSYSNGDETYIDGGSGTFELTVKAKSNPDVEYKDGGSAVSMSVNEVYANTPSTTLDVAAELTVADADGYTRTGTWWSLGDLAYVNATGTSAANVSLVIRNWLKNNVSLTSAGVLTIQDYGERFNFLTEDEVLTLNFTANVKDTEYTSAKTPIAIKIVITGVNNAPTADVYTGELDLASATTLEIPISSLGFDVDDGLDDTMIKIYGYATETAADMSWVTLDTVGEEVWLDTTDYAKNESKISLVKSATGLTFKANDAFYSLTSLGKLPIVFRYILFDNTGTLSDTTTEPDATSGATATVNVTGNYTDPVFSTTLPSAATGTTETAASGTTVGDATYHNTKVFTLKNCIDGWTSEKAAGLTYSFKLFQDAACTTELTSYTNTIIKSIVYNEETTELTVTFFQKFSPANGTAYTETERAAYDAIIAALDTSDVYLQVGVKDSWVTESNVSNKVVTLSLNEKNAANLAFVISNFPNIDVYYGDKINLTYSEDDGPVYTKNNVYISDAVFESLILENDTNVTPGSSSNNRFYLEIWQQDLVNNNFGTDYDVCAGVQFMIKYKTSEISSLFIGNNARQTGIYVSGAGVGAQVQVLGDYTYHVVTIAAPNYLGQTGKGFDADYALLVARLIVQVTNTAQTANSLDLHVLPVDHEIFPNLVLPKNTGKAYGYTRGWADATGRVSSYSVMALDSQFTVYNPVTASLDYTAPVVGMSKTESVVSNGIYIRTATEKTETDSKGSVETLAVNANYVNEWQSHYAEIWIKESRLTQMTGASVDFNFDQSLFQAYEVEFGSAFTNGEFSIDNETGTVKGISANAAHGAVSGDGYVLLARVKMEAVVNGGIDIEDAKTPHSLGWELANGLISTTSGQRSAYLGKTSSTEVWGVIYDSNDDGTISLQDFTCFANVYGKAFDENDIFTIMMDFNQDGSVSLNDFTAFTNMYGISQKMVSEGKAKVTFPDAFNRRFIGSTLETEDDTAWVGVVLDQANSDWQTALGLDEPVQVQLIVKDLGGQTLAEAKVTEYKEDGTPAAGVIYLDNDALGNTWFTQMTAPEAGTEKYDLYTVLLHELGHLYGYEIHSANANDVMSSVLNPGQRKTLTQSEIDALLQNVYSGSDPESGSVLQSDLPAGSTVAMTEITNGGSDEIVITEETNHQLNAIGLNVPAAQILPDPSRVAGAVISEIFPIEEEDDDDPDLADLAAGNTADHDYEKTLDSVLEEYLG
ncbi:MAG: hypothetical protein Q4G69_03110 [Planctomycetia bacterium]|nr:hypothetical protein [Planctomycetia bacterium]